MARKTDGNWRAANPEKARAYGRRYDWTRRTSIINPELLDLLELMYQREKQAKEMVR